MASFPIDINVTVRLTPAQLAQAFWHMDGDDQAAFFVHLGHVSSENCVSGAIDIQMCYMAEALQKHADSVGIETLRKLAEYAYKFGPLYNSAQLP